MNCRRNVLTETVAALSFGEMAANTITTSDASVQFIENDAYYIYVFTNTSGQITFTSSEPLLLTRALVVGGGGAGGSHGNANCGGRGGCGTVILSFAMPSGGTPIVSFSAIPETPTVASFSAALGFVGENANTASAWFSLGPASSAFPASELVKTDWVHDESFSFVRSGVLSGAVYVYRLAVTNDLGSGMVLEGTFDTRSSAGAYVAPTGSDTTGDGPQANPFRTVTHAITLLDCTRQPAPVIHAAPGLYDAADGEVFPIDITGVSIECADGATGDYAIFDADNDSTIIEGGATAEFIDLVKARRGVDIAVGAPVVTGMVDSFGAAHQIINCTFVGNTGGYNSCNREPYIYNSILADETLSITPYDLWMDHKSIRIHNTIVFGMDAGTDGYNANESQNVMFDDPQFKNVSVAWDSPLFDARLEGTSTARDVGRNDFIQAPQPSDLDGTVRIRVSTIANAKAGADPVVDLGCYEGDPVSSGTLIFVR